MTEEDSPEPPASSRRSLTNRSTVVSGPVALGAGGTAAGAGERGAVAQQRLGNALVFSYDFYPGADFRVTLPLEESQTVDVLDGPNDRGIPEISQPDEYDGYVITYRIGRSSIYAFVFTRDASLQRDVRYRFGGGSQVFSSRLNLLQVPLRRGR